MTDNERKLISGLLQIRDAVVRGVPGIEDTVWVTSIETMVDRIDVVLRSVGAEEVITVTKVHPDLFPLYEMRVDGVRRFGSKYRAAEWLDSLFSEVEFGETVIEPGMVLRPMTGDDKNTLVSLADEIGANK